MENAKIIDLVKKVSEERNEIAFSEIFLTYAYKKFFMYVLPESMEPDSLVQLLSTDYKFAVSFSILVIVLLYRPSGIFKGKVL